MTDEQTPPTPPEVLSTPQNFAELVALVMHNSQRLDALEQKLETLQEWVRTYPSDGAREIFAGLVRTEIDEYRKTAEVALKELAQAIHEEIATLKGGMTLGAADAIADLATKIQLDLDMHKRTQANQQVLLERMAAVATTQEQAATFDAGVERLVATFQPFWETQKAEFDAARAEADKAQKQRAADDAREKAARLVREQRKAARDARRDKLAAAVAVPLLTSGATTPMALLLALSGALPPRIVIAAAVALMAFSIGWGVYWLIFRAPPEDAPTEERSVDRLPAVSVPPPADGSAPVTAPVVTTATTTVTTTVTPPHEPPQETP